jgi:hypothetical protein
MVKLLYDRGEGRETDEVLQEYLFIDFYLAIQR